MIQIAYYDGLQKEKRKKVEKVLKSFSYPYVCLEVEDLQQPIGTLLGLTGYTRKTPVQGVTSTMELMIIQELSDEQIQTLSQALKDHGAHVPCKAMLTKHNKDWILLDLLDEIAEEHAYFEQLDRLKQAIMELSTLQEQSYSKNSWEVYQHACIKGYMLLDGKQQPSLEQIEEHLQNILISKTALQSV